MMGKKEQNYSEFKFANFFYIRAELHKAGVYAVEIQQIIHQKRAISPQELERNGA